MEEEDNWLDLLDFFNIIVIEILIDVKVVIDWVNWLLYLVIYKG